MNTYKLPVITLLVGLLLGALLAWKLLPTKTIVEQKETIKVEYKTDETVIQAAIEKWKSENKTYWKEIQYISKPCPACPTICGQTPPKCEDNVQIIYVERQGGSQTNSDGSKDTNTQSDTHSEGKSDTKIVTKYSQPQWMATAMLGLGVNKNMPLTYGGLLQRRLAGPIWAGAWVNGGLGLQGGLSLSAEW